VTFFMRPNRVKQLLQEGKTAWGSGLGQFRSAEVPRLYAAAGLDWTFIDTEHGNYDLETVTDIIRTSLLTTLTPIVRVGDLQYSLVARSLDVGAEGIIFPRVESPELLEKAISWTKFPPRGVRGYGLTIPQIGYQQAGFDEIIQHMNDNVLVVLQIETQTALQRCDDLLSVPGVDIVMVGPADLSISLGVPGQFDHPKMIEAITGVIESCRRHKVFPGIQTRALPMARFWAQQGMRFVGCGNDWAFLWEKVRDTVKELRA
jgi:2-dehydro-3-deoxyglucarate aldolase/4-hydroxy-2-oxoheptanedioate aldolase